MSFANKAASVVPPVQGENVWKFAGSDYSTVGYITIPEGWKGAYLTFAADGDKFYVAFSTSATGNASSSKTAKSTVSSNAVSAIGANVLEAIPDGSTRDFDMAKIRAHKVKTLIILSDTGAGNLTVRNSSKPVD